MTIESDPEIEEEEEHEINEETGEKVKIKKGDSAGPWNKVAGSNVAAEKEKSSTEQAETKEDDKQKETSAKPQAAAAPRYQTIIIQ